MNSKQHIHQNDCIEGFQPDKNFRNSTCTICGNQRPKIGWKRDFTYAELQDATAGFSTKSFLFDNEFCSMYKGELNGVNIIVKQHKDASFQGEKEFKSAVHGNSSKEKHENLVMLIGSCSEGSRQLLVYEYVCFGSLDQHLSKPNIRFLSWDQKMKIATGAAKGLKHLHDNDIVHGSVRSNNILITHDYESVLGDFGLTRTQHEGLDLSVNFTIDAGSLGYLAPECGRKMSKKIDVYAFGVILLQLITGLSPTDKKLGGKSLVVWARPLLKEKSYPDLIDSRNAEETHDILQLFWMVRIIEKCLDKNPNKRLSMDKIVAAFDSLKES